MRRRAYPRTSAGRSRLYGYACRNADKCQCARRAEPVPVVRKFPACPFTHVRGSRCERLGRMTARPLLLDESESTSLDPRIDEATGG